MAITYQHDVGRLLSADEVDANFKSLVASINAILADRPTPNEIVSVTRQGLQITFNLADGSTLGPLDIPAVTFHFFDGFIPFNNYVELDTLSIDGIGIFTTIRAHNTGATFDPLLATADGPVYRKIFGFSDGDGVIYDIGFYYPGRLSDSTSTRLFELPVPRKLLIPAIGAHQVTMLTPPSVSNQFIAVYLGTTQIGTITVNIGANIGTVAITADTTYQPGDLLGVGLAGISDATAAGLSVVFAAKRLTI